MDEVSWKVFQFYSEHLTSRGISAHPLIEGLPRGEALLSGARRWYDWDEHIVICERFAKLCGGAEAAEAAAADATTARWTLPIRALARQFTHPRHVYVVSMRVFAPYLYRHIHFTFAEPRRNQVKLTIDLPLQYQPCELVFRMWRGAYRAAPRMLGMQDARVFAEITPHRAIYTIDLPPNENLVHRAKMRLRALIDHPQLIEQLSQHQLQLRETYEALARAHQDFREILQASPDAVFIHRKGALTYANTAGAHALGEPVAADLVGRDLLQWVTPEDRAPVAAFLAEPDPEAQSPSVVRSLEFALAPSGGGAPVALEAHACGPFLFEGVPSSVLVTRDVTERRSAEIAVRNSERMQRALLAAMPDVILRVARDGTVTALEGARNHSLRPLLEELRSLSEDLVDSDDGQIPWTQEAHAHVALALAGASDLVFEFAVGHTHSPRHYECRTVAEDDQTALCVIRDITSERRLEHQLRVAERMASLGTLAAGVAHEINNPLMYMMANLQTLVGELRPGSSVSFAMQSAAREALGGIDRIRDIVRGIKMFTRPETTTLGPVDVNAVIDSVLRVVGPSVRRRAEIVKELGKVVVARTNASQLEQILVNLLVNATQAFGDARIADGDKVWIRTATRDDGSITIEVADNGPGISKEVQERIFDPFFTTKPVGSGTGLGLSICHRIVTQLEGTITVESALGAGAKFKVILPGSTLDAAARESSVPPPVPGNGQPLRVLLVDDEVLITKTLKLVLHGYSVTIANGGAEAIRLLGAADFDIVICDVRMPDVGGLDVYRYLRAHKPALASRMVFMTGDAFTVGPNELDGSTDNICLEKPFTEDALRAAIRHVLGSHGESASSTAQADSRSP